MPDKASPVKGIIKSLGLVFGDIGTSPIYTLTVIFLLPTIVRTEDSVIGVLSLIVWTLVILVTVQYAWLAMSLGKRGEGGTIVLRELLVPLLKSGRQAAVVTMLSFIGISLIIGDGVITPAISILSAVEGMLLITGFEGTNQTSLVVIAGAIAILLFSFQKKGTERVAKAFGPLMIIWFAALTVSGVASIYHMPSVVKAVNPYYAFKFMAHNGIAGFFVLSEVILCATGGEALYADMGHLGREPIVRAWNFVFVALVLNYLGQGAFLIGHPEARNVLFEMVYHQAQVLYIPFLLLSIIRHDHRIAGHDQRHVLDRVPGHHHAHHAHVQGGLHVRGASFPDLYRLRELVPAFLRAFHHHGIPGIEQACGRLRSCGHRHHDPHRHLHDLDLLSQEKIRPRGRSRWS